MGDSDFDDILIKVAKKLYDDESIEKLGKALGFGRGEISNYLRTNMRFAEVTSKGTLTMLRKWQMNVGKAEERSLLRQKLIEAGLRGVADSLLPETAPANPQVSQATAQATAPSIVTDRQIIKLSKILPGYNYSHLAVALGVDLNESGNIKTQHLLDNRAATEDLLSVWKVRTGGRIDELDQALKEAQCAGLIESYKK